MIYLDMLIVLEKEKKRKIIGLNHLLTMSQLLLYSLNLQTFLQPKSFFFFFFLSFQVFLFSALGLNLFDMIFAV